MVWYQGKQDGGLGLKYKGSLSALISGWRDKFQSPRLPFLIVQLPGFGGDYSGGFPGIREAQALAVREVPNTALVVTIDTGDAKNIHPKKAEVGRRAPHRARGVAHAGAHFGAAGG